MTDSIRHHILTRLDRAATSTIDFYRGNDSTHNGWVKNELALLQHEGKIKNVDGRWVKDQDEGAA